MRVNICDISGSIFFAEVAYLGDFLLSRRLYTNFLALQTILAIGLLGSSLKPPISTISDYLRRTSMTSLVPIANLTTDRISLAICTMSGMVALTSGTIIYISCNSPANLPYALKIYFGLDLMHISYKYRFINP